jgi:hypothetical protein
MAAVAGCFVLPAAVLASGGSMPRLDGFAGVPNGISLL